MTEKQLRDSIVQALNYMGYWVWSVNTGAMNAEYKGKSRFIRFNSPGTPDIMGIQKGTGVFVAIEVKLPGKEKTLTPAQESFLEMVKNNNGIAFMTTSVEQTISSLGAFNTKKL